MSRAPWHSRIMALAEWWSQWSTCRWLACGAVVVDDDWQVLASGFNGTPRGQAHCSDLKDRPRDWHRSRCLHAERNCIIQAARVGISLRGATMYTTHRPCLDCAGHLAQVGLRAVVWLHQYTSDGAAEEAVAIMQSGGIAVRQFIR